jgi:predicted nucleotidyltransferase
MLQEGMTTFARSPWLDASVQRLRDRLDPERILLFGSRARGTETRRSDLDLLLVLRTEAPPLTRIGQVLELLADSPWPVEVIVYTPEELAARADTPFIRRILREGRVLHERRAA